MPATVEDRRPLSRWNDDRRAYGLPSFASVGARLNTGVLLNERG
jgi:hypothetical protein